LLKLAVANQRGNAAGSCGSAEKDGGGLDEEDSNPSPVTSSALTGSALTGSDPEEEIVQEEATPKIGQMAAAWTNQRGKAAGSCGSVEKDGGGREEEDSKPLW
jgi:hypothetical protein